MLGVRRAGVTDPRDDSMMLSPTLARTPFAGGELSAVARTGNRAARVTTFMFETWSRLAARGAVSPREKAREASWVSENACALHGVRPSVRGQVPNQPCVLVANHISYFDPVVLSSFVPLTAVAKREVGGWPVIGEVSRKLGTLYVTREDAHSGARCLREAMRALEAGVSVLVFPEGTTTHGDSVLPFKRGIFGVAARMNVPVVPVSLRYDCPEVAWVGDESFLPHYMRSMTRACTRVNVRFMEPLSVPTVADAADVAEAARRSITRGLWMDSFASSASSVHAAWHLVSA
ncbi:MAG: lysophospholipid acyltransferase family protein [Myxococcales bacterium]